MMKRQPVAYLEAVVRIPLYAEDKYGPNGPGDWWEYSEPGICADGLTECRRPVTEISRRMLVADHDARAAYTQAATTTR